jgi:peptidyl-prolyl cis-trans isomerase D
MFASLQKFAKSWLAAALLGLLIISFAVFGINDQLLSSAGASWVVKAGKREISAQEFKLFFDQAKGRLEQQYQQQIPSEAAVQQGFDQQLLADLAMNESLATMLDRMGIIAPKSLIADELKKIPVFFDPITGRFDEAAYRSALSRQDLTPEVFEKSISDDLVRNQLVGALTAGFQAPRIYSALQGAYALEERDISYLVVSPESVGAVAPPTDAALTAFLKENAARFTRPEIRTISVVRFTADAFKDQVTVDPKELEKRFNFRKDTLSKPETRTIAQVSVKSDKAAADAIARLSKGEDPAAVAKAVGGELVSFSDKPKTAIFDPAVAGAAFSLPQGGVSGPLKGQFGLAVVKVLAIAPGKVATLEENRASLEAEILKDAAANKAYAQGQAFDEAHRSGANLAAAAAKAGAKVITFGPITADGRGPDGQPVAGLTPEILKTAFEQTKGGESDLVEVTPGDQFAVRVDAVTPPSLTPLDQVRPNLSRLLIARERNSRMQKKADDLAARVRKGESLDAVAVSAGARVVRLAKMTRVEAESHKALGQELLKAVYEGNKGDVFTAPAPNLGILVVKIDTVRSGSVGQVAELTERQRAGFTQEVFQDVGTSTRTYARDTVKAKFDRARAISALGLDPKQFIKSDDKAKDGKDTAAK